MEIDGHPLSPQARHNLDVATRVAGIAAGRTNQPNIDVDVIAVNVLDAFRRAHRIENGVWIPRASVRLSTGALVPRVG